MVQYESDETKLVADDGRNMEKPRLGALTRYMMVFMSFLGFANVYSMRVNLSVAIVYMVNHTAIATNDSSGGGGSDVCPAPGQNGTGTNLHDGK
jgi:hypothetical protein